MTDPSLSIAMVNGIAEVGGRFQGRLRRSPELDDLAPRKQPVRAVQLLLHYWTEGRGRNDAGDIARVDVPVDRHGRLDVEFALAVPPSGPISYDGRLIRVIWGIQATVDVKYQLDRKLHVPVLVIPQGGWGLYHAPHPLR